MSKDHKSYAVVASRGTTKRIDSDQHQKTERNSEDNMDDIREMAIAYG
jgi:hypothetical protein